ncbi:microfibrillar-associated protein 1-like [Liolophura sinensis]|uniref:microfibrillar-associated protein 1-like n=1 Tax=Liolophura sinensis TaxID=3198878 RepID=UPI00315850C9
MSSSRNAKVPIQSTAGAVPVKNEKGEFTMEKVKVARYVTGKRPDFAPESSSGEESDTEFNLEKKKNIDNEPEREEVHEAVIEDRRLRRLQEREADSDDEDDRVTRHRRQIIEPEIVAEVASEDEVEEKGKWKEEEESSGEEEEELDEEELERRRALLRQRALQRREEEEVMDLEDEKSEGESEEESSEYEEYTDSEEETGPRLKPVFVRKKDRITIQEKEKEEHKQREREDEVKRMAEERRKQTLKMVEDEVRKDFEEERGVQDACDAVDTGDENDEEEYEAWKVRELRRMKRDREEREAIEKEKLEIDRVRNLTEEERRAELRQNPKQVTNKAPKGKYKFLQKYYHRGSFFLQEREEDVYKQDFSSPTLDDHFDKSILPKVMQVKNFGRSGRTKYTHLVDQDTTQFDSPWMVETAQNLKFHTTKGGGMKQGFERPSLKKRK